MNTTLLNNKCKLVNIVWIDRCIKLAIIFNIIKYYKKLLYKNIIIDNREYRKFSKIMFPELTFKKFNKLKINNNKNFYFNIKQTLIKKDIFIDYINNYISNIPTKKMYYIPWYDINDPIITFKYSKKNKLNYSDENDKIINFSKCLRGSNNKLWDSNMEYFILNNYKINKSISNINIIYDIFNNLLKQNYLNYYEKKIFIPIESSKKCDKVECPKLYYSDETNNKIDELNKINTQMIKNITNKYEEKIKYLNIDKNDSLDELIKLIKQYIDINSDTLLTQLN